MSEADPALDADELEKRAAAVATALFETIGRLEPLPVTLGSVAVVLAALAEIVGALLSRLPREHRERHTLAFIDLTTESYRYGLDHPGEEAADGN